MHRTWFAVIGILLVITAFAALWPASIYAAQPFNTNLFFGFFGAVILALGLKKNGS